MIALDATHLRCPEFTVPMMRLIKQHQDCGKDILIKTHEPRSIVRVQHLCLSFDWTLVAHSKSGDTIFIKIKC